MSKTRYVENYSNRESSIQSSVEINENYGECWLKNVSMYGPNLVDNRVFRNVAGVRYNISIFRRFVGITNRSDTICV